MHITQLERELQALIDQERITKELLWEVLRKLVVSLKRGSFLFDKFQNLLNDPEETLRFINRYKIDLLNGEEYLFIRSKNAFLYVSDLIERLEKEQKKRPAGTQSHDRDRMVIFFKVSSNAYKNPEQYLLKYEDYHKAIKSIVEEGVYPEPDKLDQERLLKGGKEAVYRPLRKNLIAETDTSDDFTLMLAFTILNLNVEAFQSYLLQGVTSFDQANHSSEMTDEVPEADEEGTPENMGDEPPIEIKDPKYPRRKTNIWLTACGVIALLVTWAIWFSHSGDISNTRTSLALHDLFSKTYPLDDQLETKDEFQIHADTFFTSEASTWIRLNASNLSSELAYFPDAIVFKPDQLTTYREPGNSLTRVIAPEKYIELQVICDQKNSFEWIIESKDGKALFIPRKQAITWLKISGKSYCEGTSLPFQLGLRYHSSASGAAEIKMIDQQFFLNQP